MQVVLGGLLVLAAPPAQAAWQPALARFVALLWDAGLAASQTAAVGLARPVERLAVASLQTEAKLELTQAEAFAPIYVRLSFSPN